MWGLTAVLAGLLVTAPQAPERTELSIDAPTRLSLAPGSTLEIKGVYGEIVVVKAAGPDTSISIGRDPGPDAPRLEMLTHDRGATLCAVYPTKNAKKTNECVPGTKGRLTEGTRKDSPATRFRVELAEGVHLMGRLFSGDIKVEGVTGNVDVETLTGNVFLVDAGSQVLQASVSLKGDLDAVISPRKGPEERRVSLKGGIGELRVTPPDSLRISYYISSDRDIENTFTTERLSKGLVTGVWGPEGPTDMRLSLTTGAMFGSLKLRRPR